MNTLSRNENLPNTHQIQGDALGVQVDDTAEHRPGNELDQAREVVPGGAVLAEGEELPKYVYASDGSTSRLVDGEDFCVSDPDDRSEDDWEEDDPVASARLHQRTIAQFSRHHYRMSPEQHAERRRRWAAKRAQKAREQRVKVRNKAARNARPEPTMSAHPHTPRTRRPSTRVNAATASPQPSPPEPDPALAVAAVTSVPETAAFYTLTLTPSARAVSHKPPSPHLRPATHALAAPVPAALLHPLRRSHEAQWLPHRLLRPQLEGSASDDLGRAPGPRDGPLATAGKPAVVMKMIAEREKCLTALQARLAIIKTAPSVLDVRRVRRRLTAGSTTYARCSRVTRRGTQGPSGPHPITEVPMGILLTSPPAVHPRRAAPGASATRSAAKSGLRRCSPSRPAKYSIPMMSTARQTRNAASEGTAR